MKRLIALVVFLALAAALLGAAVYIVGLLGYWTIPLGLGLLIGVPFLLKFLIKAAIKRFVMGLFGMKSGALSKATTEVHEVMPALLPRDLISRSGDESSESVPVPSKDFWLVDLTIKPNAEQSGPMCLWEPGELRLIRPGASPGDDDCDLGHPTKIEVLQSDNSWADDEGGKYPGSQRLRILFQTATGTAAADLSYYFERLGTVRFVR